MRQTSEASDSSSKRAKRFPDSVEKAIHHLVSQFTSEDRAFGESWIRAALRQIAPGKILELLNMYPNNSDDILMLIYEAGIAQSCCSPLYARDELASVFKTSLAHLESRQSAVLKQGWTRPRKARCPWLDDHLFNLYPFSVVQSGSPLRAKLMGLKRKDREFIKFIRPTVFDLKTKVVKCCNDAFAHSDSKRLWRECLEILTDPLVIDGELADKLLDADLSYPKRGLTPISGGLLSIIKLFQHIHIELTGEVWSRGRKSLRDVIEHTADGYPTYSLCVIVDMLLQGRPNEVAESFRSYLKCNLEWAKIAAKFNKELGKEVQSRLLFRGTLSFVYELSFSDGTEFQQIAESHLNILEQHVKRNGPEQIRTMQLMAPFMGLGQLSESAPPKVFRPVFPRIKGLRWEEVTLAFISDDILRVSAHSTSKKFNYSEIGFLDGRMGDKPDTRWRLLIVLASQDGLSWNSAVDQTTQNRAKKAISELRQRLKAIVGIDDDPFFPYKKKRGWQPRFRLEDRRSGN